MLKSACCHYLSKEFLAFYEFAPSVTTEEKFQRYLQFGGMPILREYQFNEAEAIKHWKASILP